MGLLLSAAAPNSDLGSPSWPFLRRCSLALSAAAPDLRRGVAPLGHTCAPSQPPVLDILECEVKWALESITTNKASGGNGIPVEPFQILKDNAVKVLHSICQQIWKNCSGHMTSRRRHTVVCDWSSDVCSSDLLLGFEIAQLEFHYLH